MWRDPGIKLRTSGLESDALPTELRSQKLVYVMLKVNSKNQTMVIDGIPFLYED